MILGNLTRFPGTTMPKEAITRNPILDGFLSKLDGHLWGAAKVRFLFLAETKENIFEKYDHLVAIGCSEEIAMKNAVQSMGPPYELAKSQKTILKMKFLRIGLLGGIYFALFQGLLGYFNQYLRGKGLVFLCLYGLVHGVYFGLFVGWFATFFWPERRLPSASMTDGSSEAESEFVVQYSRWLQLLSYPMTVFFALAGISLIFMGIAGLFNSSISRFSPYPWWINIILGGMGVLCFFFARLSSRKYKVKEACVYVEEFLGRNKVFTWKNLKKVGLLGDKWSWAPFYWKKVKYAEFENEKHKAISMFVYPDMVNADRLFILLDKKVIR